MDLESTYSAILSTILAIKISLLVPLFLLTAILPPLCTEVECPAPKGDTGTKTLDIPDYPSPKSLAFLIAVYFFDILLLYPYTPDGANTPYDSSFRIVGVIGILLQTMSAIGWAGIEPNWDTAEALYGLWFNKFWSWYYMSFILVGIAIGLPLIYKAMWWCGELTVLIAPMTWKAICNAYAPLKVWQKL
jgi:hypothetical protein